MGFLSRDVLFHSAFWDFTFAACLDPALNCNSILQSQNSASVCFFSSSLAWFLCLGTTYSFLPVAHTDNAPWPEPQAYI